MPDDIHCATANKFHPPAQNRQYQQTPEIIYMRSLLSHNFSQQGELCAVDGVMGVWWIAAQQWQQRSPFEQIQL
ncbi:MAG: hypothetical protein ACR2KU_08345, partial [Gammaproteobacteria bacterium]